MRGDEAGGKSTFPDMGMGRIIMVMFQSGRMIVSQTWGIMILLSGPMRS